MVIYKDPAVAVTTAGTWSIALKCKDPITQLQTVSNFINLSVLNAKPYINSILNSTCKDWQEYRFNPLSLNGEEQQY